MKRICILTHIFPARSETFVKEHALGFARRGYKVTVVARERGADITPAELQILDDAGLERVYLSHLKSSSAKISKLLNALQLALAMLKRPALYRLFAADVPWKAKELLIACKVADYISRHDFDLVHAHFGTLGAKLQLVASYYRHLPPLIVTWHGYDANAIPASHGVDVYRALFASGVLHTVGSSFMKRRLLLLGARETCVSLIPMGIDPERFKYSMRDVTDDEPLRIVSVGRLDEVKGHTYLIQAIRQLVDQGGDVKLRIVGDGPLGAALKAEIAAANLNERVVMVGAIPSEQVIDELHHAHLFALTGVETKSGKAEAQGVVFAEAQATGLPVIACDVGGTADGMVNGESGVLCATRDVASVVAALEDFSADRAKITRFGRAGRRFVEQHYSIHAMLDRFERLYDEQL